MQVFVRIHFLILIAVFEFFFGVTEVEASFSLASDSSLASVLGHSLKASRKIFFTEGVIGAPCSGQFISNQGHFLTSAHCIRQLSAVYKRLGYEKKTIASIGYFEKSDKIQMNVPVVLDKNFFSMAFPKRTVLKPYSAMILYSGKKFIDEFPVFSQLVYSQHAQELDGNDDFLLLKLNQKTPCVTVKRNGFDPEVFNVGFSGETLKVGDQVFGDYQQLVSAGKILNSFSDAGIFRSDRLIAFMDNHFGFLQSMFFSTAPISRGMSGGMAINGRGEFLGITYGGFSDFTKSDHPYQDITMAISVERIQKKLGEVFSKSQIDAFFNCR